MLLQVLHETRYDYSAPVENAQHLAYLRPLEHAAQQVLMHELRISPEPVHQRTAADIYGNSRTHFSLRASHGHLVVQAQSLVRTSATADPRKQGSASWEQVRQRCQYQSGAAWDGAIEFAFASPCAPRSEAFAEFARPSFMPGRPMAEASWDLMERIHRFMRYESHSTEVNTPALQALQQGKGVCQDFAHILVACCRSMGLPARYVSGYMLTKPAPGQPRLVGSDASHAWASVYCLAAEPARKPGNRESGDGPAGYWLDLDPTNNRMPGQDYVTVACGRDFLDVSPLRGVIQGGSKHNLSVAVTVSPVDQESAASMSSGRLSRD
ncbi:MAG: transglutaminase family protein [Betaproteobacteria bacterium]